MVQQGGKARIEVRAAVVPATDLSSIRWTFEPRTDGLVPVDLRRHLREARLDLWKIVRDHIRHIPLAQQSVKFRQFLLQQQL